MCRSSAPQNPHGPPVAPSLDGTVSPDGALEPRRAVLTAERLKPQCRPKFVIPWGQCYRAG
jgi:hypothetical protein